MNCLKDLLLVQPMFLVSTVQAAQTQGMRCKPLQCIQSSLETYWNDNNIQGMSPCNRLLETSSIRMQRPVLMPTDMPASDTPVQKAPQLQQLAAEAQSLPLLQRCTQNPW